MGGVNAVRYDDEAHIFGSLAIVVDVNNRFRAVFLHSAIDGTLSTFDLKAERFITAGKTGRVVRCGNCSMSGHNKCSNEGVRPSKKLMMIIYKRRNQ